MEYGFIDDTPNNVKFLENNYKELAEAVIKAVADYKGYNYVSPDGVILNTYIVKSGDSLYSIARKFNTTVSKLQEINNLSSNLLSIGQVLKLPSGKEIISPVEENIYVVQSGDSLYSIARKFNTTVSKLQEINNLSSNLLSIGQVLKISVEEIIPPVDVETYIVQSGDSLYSIARKFNTTVNKLQEINNLSNNLLSIGQVLKIPNVTPSQEPVETYVVQSGDSLYSIARKFNTTVDEIKKANKLINNLLSIGQVLVLPTITENQTTYVVQSGDSLYSIARKFNTSVEDIKSLNNLSSNLLSIGQILIIK